MEISKLKFWIFIILAFFVGAIIFAGDSKPEPEERRDVEVKEVEKIKEVEVCPNEECWKELKEIDDEGFMVASEGFFIVSDIFNAMADGDMVAVEDHLYRLERKEAEMEEVADERNEILDKLGY